VRLLCLSILFFVFRCYWIWHFIFCLSTKKTNEENEEEVKMAAGPPRGAFILLEGVDRSGKSTQGQMLVERLSGEGHRVKHIVFPDRQSPVTGAILDNYLKKGDLDAHVAFLLFSANRWERAKEMEEWLLSGGTLVVDRYAYSGAAYCFAKSKLPIEHVSTPDIGLPAPDLVLQLRIDMETLSKRGGFGEEIFEVKELQSKVQDVFDRFAVLNVHKGWKKIDANTTVTALHETITELAINVIDEVKDKPLKWLSHSNFLVFGD
jgi:dTMP kinase